MPVILAQLGTTIAGVLASMGMQLVTAQFIKALTVRALHAIVKKTASTDDDAILRSACQAWGVECPSDLVIPPAK